MMDIINPATCEVFAIAPNSSAVDVDQAFNASGVAFAKWRRSTPSKRQRALLKLADVIEGNAEELVAAGAMISTLSDLRRWAPILATGRCPLTPGTQAQRLQTVHVPGANVEHPRPEPAAGGAER